jgi:glyoxylase-like metal-dependent hydrolase (beta-lactamase superfamily II)
MSMAIPLEDNYSDVISKAQRGLGISDSQLAAKSAVEIESLREVRDGKVDRLTIQRIAPALHLNSDALLDLAEAKFQPDEIRLDGLQLFNTPYHDMRVNAYLAWDPASKEAVAFDSGATCSSMLEFAQGNGLTIKLILLTHSHPDHVADLDRLKDATGAPVYISGREEAHGAQSIEEGESFTVGRLTIESRLTWGHSPGGMTFVVRGLERPVAVVGDSLFAGSMGGGNISYQDAVENNLKKILTLPDETVLCPGHGPITTVAEEKKHNPFFAGRS